MQAICFIAARGGSKGIPNKNIRKIAGKPLIAHTIISAKKSNLFKHVIVSTDNYEIAKIAKKFGAEVPFLRPKKLASNYIGIVNVLLHGIEKLFSLEYSFDILVSRDCTVPFIQNKDIKGSIDLLTKKQSDAVFGVYRQHLNPYFNMVELNSKGFLKISKNPKNEIFSRQNAPAVYQLNGLFTFKVQRLLKYRKLLMPKVIPYEIPPETGLMIDTEFEFQLAKIMFKNKPTR